MFDCDISKNNKYPYYNNNNYNKVSYRRAPEQKDTNFRPIF